MSKQKLGSGGRFKTLAKKVGSPALAAYIGRKKYGKKKFQKLASKGKAKNGGLMLHQRLARGEQINHK